MAKAANKDSLSEKLHPAKYVTASYVITFYSYEHEYILCRDGGNSLVRIDLALSYGVLHNSLMMKDVSYNLSSDTTSAL